MPRRLPLVVPASFLQVRADASEATDDRFRLLVPFDSVAREFASSIQESKGAGILNKIHLGELRDARREAEAADFL
eukprot:7427185-Prorocentrum_lima.AAC.1